MYPKFFATTNANKLREVNEILGEKLESIEIELVEPQALDVEEVVKEKAKDAFAKTGKPVLVEDTGVYVDAWQGLRRPSIGLHLELGDDPGAAGEP